MVGDSLRQPVTTTISSFEILELLKQNGGHSLGELDDELDLARSTIHRHLLTLVENGFIIKKDSVYDIGLRFLDFGSYAQQRQPLYQVGQLHAKILAKEFGEDIWIGTEQNNRLIHIIRGNGEKSNLKFTRIGVPHHLHHTAGGKVILADFTDEEIKDYVSSEGLPKRTENTITNLETLFNELYTVREQGFATCYEETIKGMNEISVPIQKDGQIVGILSMVGATYRLDRSYLSGPIQEKLLEASNKIEIHLSSI